VPGQHPFRDGVSPSTVAAVKRRSLEIADCPLFPNAYCARDVARIPLSTLDTMTLTIGLPAVTYEEDIDENHAKLMLFFRPSSPAFSNKWNRPPSPQHVFYDE